MIIWYCKTQAHWFNFINSQDGLKKTTLCDMNNNTDYHTNIRLLEEGICTFECSIQKLSC